MYSFETKNDELPHYLLNDNYFVIFSITSKLLLHKINFLDIVDMIFFLHF